MIDKFLYIVLPLVTFLISVYLGAWMLYKGPRERLNRVFALLTAAIAFWAIADVGIRTAAASDIALAWARISGFGWIFIGATFLHFVLVSTRREKILENKLSYLALYGPGIFFLGILWLTGEIYSGMQQAPLGFVAIQGRSFLAAVAYVEVALILGIYCCFRAYRGFTGIEKKQAGLIGVSVLVPVVGGTLTEVVLPLMKIKTYELGTTLLLPTVIIFAIAIVKYKLSTLPLITRFFIPMPEAYLPTKPKYKLGVGRAYLIKEKGPDHSVRLFMDQVTHGIPGLWITSLHPRVIREKYDMNRTPILYVDAKRPPGEARLSITQPTRIERLVQSQLARVRERAVVMLDCFKELTVANGFEKALDFLGKLNKLCSENNSNLIVQIDPSKYTKQQLAAMEKVLSPL